MRARVSLTPAGVTVAVLSRMPGQIMIEILTLLTVEATSVVFADAGPMNLAGWVGKWSALSSHACPCPQPYSSQLKTLTMPSAWAGAPGAGAHCEACP